jgi:hypothetical protein
LCGSAWQEEKRRILDNHLGCCDSHPRRSFKKDQFTSLESFPPQARSHLVNLATILPAAYGLIESRRLQGN